jgi:hypothetical protein
MLLTLHGRALKTSDAIGPVLSGLDGAAPNLSGVLSVFYSVQSIDKFFQVYLSTGLRPRPFAPGISSGIVEITIDTQPICAAA